MKQRGLQSVRLIVSDKSTGLLDAMGDFFPESRWQRCVVHFYRNILNAVPTGKSKVVSTMLKAIHAQEDKEAARQKAEQISAKLKALHLEKAARILRRERRRLSLSMSFRPITGVISEQITHWSGSIVKFDDAQEWWGTSLTASRP